MKGNIRHKCTTIKRSRKLRTRRWADKTHNQHHTKNSHMRLPSLVGQTPCTIPFVHSSRREWDWRPNYPPEGEEETATVYSCSNTDSHKERHVAEDRTWWRIVVWERWTFQVFHVGGRKPSLSSASCTLLSEHPLTSWLSKRATSCRSSPRHVPKWSGHQAEWLRKLRDLSKQNQVSRMMLALFRVDPLHRTSVIKKASTSLSEITLWGM